jgi:hypothetical protein
MLTCKFFCYKDNPRAELISKAVKMIQHDTDIIRLLDKIQEIDKIKQLLLDDTQIKVFNFSPKPLVTLTQNPEM